MIDSIDKKFFKALKSGDKERINSAFEGVYRAYVKLVAFIVCEYIDDKETVKEVTNDVFLSLFNHAKAVNGSVKYYLSVSARNAAINRLSAEKRNKGLPLDAAEKLRSHDFHNEVLLDLKRSLSDEEVNLIVMHAVEGYTFKEIAETLNKNPNTVMTIYRRALKKYKKETKGNE